MLSSYKIASSIWTCRFGARKDSPLFCLWNWKGDFRAEHDLELRKCFLLMVCEVPLFSSQICFEKSLKQGSIQIILMATIMTIAMMVTTAAAAALGSGGGGDDDDGDNDDDGDDDDSGGGDGETPEFVGRVASHCAALHRATPRHATPRHATPRHAGMLRYATLCHAMLCRATPRHAMPRHATPRHANATHIHKHAWHTHARAWIHTYAYAQSERPRKRRNDYNRRTGI